MAILFLTFFTVNFAGIYLYFTFQLAAIRQEMRAALRDAPDDQLIHLALPVEDYKKSLNGERELNINGRFYDISRVRFEGEMVHVYCLFDEAESDLVSFVGKILHEPKPSHHPIPPSVAQFVLLTYIVPGHQVFILTVSPTLNTTQVSVPPYHCDLDNESPPPKGGLPLFSSLDPAPSGVRIVHFHHSLRDLS